jgi:hypothetical protein
MEGSAVGSGGVVGSGAAGACVGCAGALVGAAAAGCVGAAVGVAVGAAQAPAMIATIISRAIKLLVRFMLVFSSFVELIFDFKCGHQRFNNSVAFVTLPAGLQATFKSLLIFFNRRLHLPDC